MLFSLSLLLLLAAHPTAAQFGDLQGILSKFLNGGSSSNGTPVDPNAAPTVDANGQLQNAGSLLPSGLSLPAGFSLDKLQAALKNLNLGELGFLGQQAQTGQQVAGSNSFFDLVNGFLTDKNGAAGTQVGNNVATTTPFDFKGQIEVLKDKVLQTLSSLSLQNGASLNLDPNSQAVAGVLQLLGNNNINVADNANLKAGLLLVNQASSKIAGSFEVLKDRIAQIAPGATLQLGDPAAAAGGAQQKIADILARFNLGDGAGLNIQGATALLGNSTILGQGNVNINNLLDLSKVQLDPQAQQALIQAKTLALEKLGDLKLKVQQGSATLLDIKEQLKLNGGKIDINGAADLKATVLKLLYGSKDGKADITVDGQNVVDVTGGKLAPPANGVPKGNVWTVEYGNKEATLQLKSADEVYAATTRAANVDTAPLSSSSAVTVAVAAIVVAILSLN